VRRAASIVHLVLVLVLAACGGREERAPVSRPSPAASPNASSSSRADEPAPPIGFDVKESDVVVTGGIDSARDPRPLAGVPKPGDVVEVARFACEVTRQSREERATIICKPASDAPFGPDGNEFERRLAECFVVKSRAATASEVAALNFYVAADGRTLEVPKGRLFAVERRGVNREEIIEYQQCPKGERHPCDPAPMHTGRFVDRPWVDLYAFAPRGKQVLVAYQPRKLSWIALTRMPGPLESVDLSTQPPAVRAALAFDRAVEAVRTNDKKRIAAAVKEVDANVTIAEGARIEDQNVPRSVAQAIVNDMPLIRALADGRATVGDACKR